MEEGFSFWNDEALDGGLVDVLLDDTEHTDGSFLWQNKMAEISSGNSWKNVRAVCHLASVGVAFEGRKSQGHEFTFNLLFSGLAKKHVETLKKQNCCLKS